MTTRSPTRDDETHRTESDDADPAVDDDRRRVEGSPPRDQRTRRRTGGSREADGGSFTTTRRRLLQTVSVLGIGALAGCVSTGPGDGEAAEADKLPGSASMESFTRLSRTDAYQLQYQLHAGHDEGFVGLSVEKQRYVEKIEADRSLTDTFDEAVESASAARLAASLDETLDGLGFDEFPERVQAVAEFVRGFEYVTDKAGTGTMEYPKYVAETLVENEGDCEDFANVIAGVLANSPFDLDPALVVYPGHVGVGLAPEALGPDVEPTLTPGEEAYVYVDSTHDVDLGEIPEKLHGREVIATYDGGWTLHNADAFFEHLTNSVSRGYTDPSKYF